MNKVVVVVAFACALAAGDSAWALCGYFNYTISPSQVVPPSAGSGFGGSEMFLCDDQMVTGYLSVYTTDTVTAVHIHGPAEVSENGPLLFDLPLPVTNSVVLNIGPLTPDQAFLLEGEHMYVDVHSVEHPDGVLRGQIRHEVAVAPVDWGYAKRLYR